MITRCLVNLDVIMHVALFIIPCNSPKQHPYLQEFPTDMQTFFSISGLVIDSGAAWEFRWWRRLHLLGGAGHTAGNCQIHACEMPGSSEVVNIAEYWTG